MFVSMRLREELVAALNERAEAEGRNRSGMIRWAIEVYLGKSGEQEKPRRGTTNLQVAVKRQPAQEPQRAILPESSPKPVTEFDRMRERDEPVCKKEGHTGFWRSDGYWCVSCRHLYRD
jgi:hypothetical protein